MDKSLRFDWFETLEIDLLDDLTSKVLLVIDLDRSTKNQSFGQLQAQRNRDTEVTQHLLSALYQSFFIAPVGTHRVSIPTSASAYTRRGDDLLPLKFSYRSVMRVLSTLKQLGWVQVEAGNTFKGVTRMSASGKLVAIFSNTGLQWYPQRPKPPEMLVVVRDRSKLKENVKVELPTPQTQEVDNYRSFLLRYNSFLLQHCVGLALSDSQLQGLSHNAGHGSINLFKLQLRRIFSRGSLTMGGRFYGGWWQSLPSLYQPHITIDGYRTTEVDYSSVALRILYASQGAEVSPDKDLYDIGLPSWEGRHDPRRKLIKTFLNAVLNDESGAYRLPRSDLRKIGVSHHCLMTLLRQRHEPIAHLFNTTAGLEAQFIDSEIAMMVMQKMMDEEILVLPIHDSFIVRVGHRSTLNDVMLESFQAVTGRLTSTSETGPSTKELFGMNIEKTDIESRSRVITLEEAFDSEIKMPSRLMHDFVASWRRYHYARNTYK